MLLKSHPAPLFLQATYRLHSTTWSAAMISSDQWHGATLCSPRASPVVSFKQPRVYGITFTLHLLIFPAQLVTHSKSFLSVSPEKSAWHCKGLLGLSRAGCNNVLCVGSQASVAAKPLPFAVLHAPLAAARGQTALYQSAQRERDKSWPNIIAFGSLSSPMLFSECFPAGWTLPTLACGNQLSAYTSRNYSLLTSDNRCSLL